MSGDAFALFGLQPQFRIDLRELEQRYRELQRALHPDRHTHAPASVRRMNLAKAMEVNEAYRVLRDDLQRAELLLSLQGVTPAHSEAQPADPAFLMEIMELREGLSEARQARDLPRVRALAERVSAAWDEAHELLAQALEALVAGRAQAAETARAVLAKLKYYRRFLDEVSVVEEEALG